MSEGLFFKVAYDEAVRALSEQQAVVESVRSRAGLLLSVATITTSFLGSQAFQATHLSVLAWMALLAFLLMASISLAILWPRDWDVTANPREVLQVLIESEGPTSVVELHRDLSLHMHASYLENRQGTRTACTSLRARRSLDGCRGGPLDSRHRIGLLESSHG